MNLCLSSVLPLIFGIQGWEWVIVTIFLIVIFVLPLTLSDKMNKPTWKGVIFSLAIGLFPLYVILCCLGVMGEERDSNEK